ncbi:MAG: hypothetical protein Q8894_02535 [Sweet potato little leaf phytoplasma]|uniref:Uncharacterized protein n=1 Tax=Candidatus Phytoplasma fabacearum TaxID=2982628 RepID=A0ABU8ZTN1_9MOLU|nr:hypothetical protein [Pigeon pea little leaf phytoplasma]MDV3204635.1 hypothetical protein [Sweet potato little leaf phytoplasma]
MVNPKNLINNTINFFNKNKYFMDWVGKIFASFCGVIVAFYFKSPLQEVSQKITILDQKVDKNKEITDQKFIYNNQIIQETTKRIIYEELNKQHYKGIK